MMRSSRDESKGSGDGMNILLSDALLPDLLGTLVGDRDKVTTY